MSGPDGGGALARRAPEPAVYDLVRADPETRDLGPLQLAEVMYRSGLFPKLRSAATAAAKILIGREYGFGAAAALQGVHVYEDGSISMGATLLAAALRRSTRYDYRVPEHTDQAVTIEVIDRGIGEVLGAVRWTLEDASRADLLVKASGKDAKNWTRYPRAMLFSRAISEAVRVHAPDLIGGAPAYTPGELGGEEDDDGAPVDVMLGEAGRLVDAVPYPLPLEVQGAPEAHPLAAASAAAETAGDAEREHVVVMPPPPDEAPIRTVRIMVPMTDGSAALLTEEAPPSPDPRCVEAGCATPASAAPTPVEKPARKRRSDAGKPRGPKAETGPAETPVPATMPAASSLSQPTAAPANGRTEWEDLHERLLPHEELAAQIAGAPDGTRDRDLGFAIHHVLVGRIGKAEAIAAWKAVGWAMGGPPPSVEQIRAVILAALPPQPQVAPVRRVEEVVA